MNARFVRFTFNMTAARKPLALAQLMVWEHPPDCPTLTRAERLGTTVAVMTSSHARRSGPTSMSVYTAVCRRRARRSCTWTNRDLFVLQ